MQRELYFKKLSLILVQFRKRCLKWNENGQGTISIKKTYTANISLGSQQLQVLWERRESREVLGALANHCILMQWKRLRGIQGCNSMTGIKVSKGKMTTSPYLCSCGSNYPNTGKAQNQAWRWNGGRGSQSVSLHNGTASSFLLHRLCSWEHKHAVPPSPSTETGRAPPDCSSGSATIPTPSWSPPYCRWRLRATSG